MRNGLWKQSGLGVAQRFSAAIEGVLSRRLQPLRPEGLRKDSAEPDRFEKSFVETIADEIDRGNL
jgi:hypothetical protein